MKKAQMSQVFVYIMTGIVIVAVLGFGVNWIFKIMNTAEDVECMNFKQDLVSLMKENDNYGSVINETIHVGCDVKEVCFAGSTVSDSELQYYPIIQNNVDDDAKNNIFFVNNIAEDFHHAENMEVSSNENGFFCEEVKNSRISLVLEGKGDRVVVS